MVVDKPAGMRAAPDRGGRDPGVLGRLWEQCGDGELRLVYRLAADTSGCLVVARSPALAEAVEAEFAAGGIEIEYLALVSGRVRFDRRVVARHLGPDPRRPGRIRAVLPPGRRPGTTSPRAWTRPAWERRARRPCSLVSRPSRRSPRNRGSRRSWAASTRR